MRILGPKGTLEEFLARVGSATQRALLLDYDGTLAPFRVERHLARPYPGVSQALQAILDGGRTRLVLITGRTVDDLLALLEVSPVPEIWGEHGRERRLPDGTRRAPPLPPAQARALEQARQWARQARLLEHCELKTAAIALHWRGLDGPAIARLRELALAGWQPLTRGGALELREFDGGLELRGAGFDKGQAVRTILAELGPGAAVAYAGDDLTDEDAFAALAGRGLSILVREELRPTRADLWLRPPDELLDFLWRWARACGAPGR